MNNRLPKIYLASKSPRRQEILKGLKVPFELIESPYEENFDDVMNMTPEMQAAKLAGLKAFHAAGNLREGIVVGADTIVVQGDTILGKPEDKKNAESMLHSLSGKRHRVVTGIAVVDVAGLRTLSHSEVTMVFFRELSRKDVDFYLATDEPYDKAGAYGIQGHAAFFVERLEGCYFNVVGFPVVAFRNLMLQLGYDLNDYIGSEK
ncbi:MAG: nucleoside triphosphate pyrophosphatase [Clostridiales bacterium]|jgi:septum formation protein|nr:nucleoside triphosphate pyrophosphatase [Clostridiales bacterium]MDN5282583.1 nucleoside triphosphate pyrophosphatase [Candidatus Ozemobacter sp.]